MALTGKILRFDEVKGYGFIAPDQGGEDVFLHANALLDEKDAYRSGVPVEFEALESDRGLKAASVRVVRDGPLSVSDTPSPALLATGSIAVGRPATVDLTDDDGLCDVLTAAALKAELAELCLESVPSMTGEQINHLRRALTTLARRHGWVED